MKKFLTATPVILSIVIAAFSLSSCGNNSTPTVSSPSPTTAASPTASPSPTPAASPDANSLAVEDAILARNSAKAGEEVKLQPTDSNVFKRGETVYLVLTNVGKFKKGDDGKNRLDMDVEVKNTEGKVLLSRKGLLGEEGHVALENDVASSPYGNVDTSATTPVGTYTMFVTIYDKIGSGKVTKSADFKLE